MAINILVIKVGVKLGINLELLLVALCKDYRELVVVDLGVVELLRTLLGEALDANDFGSRVLFGPLGDEDVVLIVESSDIGDVAT